LEPLVAELDWEFNAASRLAADVATRARMK
jgi:hypothetical protein